MLAVVARTRIFPVLLPEPGARERGSRAGRRRARFTPLTRALVAALLVVVPAIAYVSQSTATARTGYAILTLREEVTSLQAENARLVVGVSALKSPERIERAARGRLGMVQPTPAQMAALTVPSPAVAVPAVSGPTVWQRVSALLLGREAAASER